MIMGLHKLRIEENRVGTILTLIIREKLKKKDYEVFVPSSNQVTPLLQKPFTKRTHE
jgi:hypothetical protein